MEKSDNETGIPGSKQSDLKKSFKFARRSLLTDSSKRALSPVRWEICVLLNGGNPVESSAPSRGC